MAVASGISPLDLAELDFDQLDEVEAALVEREVEQARRWTPELELLAQQTEILHSQLRAYLAAHTDKGSSLPPPLRIPRPGEKPARPDGAVVVKPSAFAAMLAGGAR